jgi:hypothetical protein
VGATGFEPVTSSVSEHTIGQTGHRDTAAAYADPQVRWGRTTTAVVSRAGSPCVVAGRVLASHPSESWTWAGGQGRGLEGPIAPSALSRSGRRRSLRLSLVRPAQPGPGRAIDRIATGIATCGSLWGLTAPPTRAASVPSSRRATSAPRASYG